MTQRSTLNIIVCIKQVPEVTNVKINPETGTLVRAGVASILNPFCEYALDMAVDLKERFGQIEITAVSMGPPQSRAALMRCLELGADSAVLLTDRRFAGADTWATAHTLATAIPSSVKEFHLVLVGKQAIDGDTAQVGPEVSEILGIPQITYAVAAEFTPNRKKIRVKREAEDGYEIQEMRLPGLVSVSKGSLIRRLPSLRDVENARRKPFTVLSAADIGLEEKELGLQGSPTQVVKIFPPQGRQGGRVVDGSDPNLAVQEIMVFLKDKKFI